MNDLLDIVEMYNGKGEVYDFSKDGFVFSEHQINAGTQRRKRENLVAEACEHRDEWGS